LQRDAPDSSTPNHLASNSSSIRRGAREGAPDQLAQQVAKLALQLALLQDRISKKVGGCNKETRGVLWQRQPSHRLTSLTAPAPQSNTQADAPTVEELSGGLSSARQHLAQQQLLLGARLAGLQDSLADLQGAQHRHAADAGMHRHAGQVHATSDATASVCEQEEVGGEAPASGKLVQHLAAQLAELKAHVARLAVPVPPCVTGSSGDRQPDAPASAEAAAGAARPLEDAAAGRSNKDRDAAASSGRGAGTDSAEAGLASGGQAGTASGAIDVVFAADVEARLADVKAQLQDIVAGKADQPCCRDSDQLEQQLHAHQSMLDHVMRQLGALGQGHSSVGGGTTRPTSAVSRGSRTASGTGQGAGGAAGSGFGQEASFFIGAANQHGHQAACADAGPSTSVPDQQHLRDTYMAAQLQAHHDSIEQLAAAVTLMATGQATAAGDTPSAASGSAYDEDSFVEGVCDSEPQTPAFSFGGARLWPTAGPAALAGLSAAAGGVGPGPHATRLEQLLQ
jgi:hypothetical protein